MLLDSCFLIDLLRESKQGRKGSASLKLSELGPQPVAVSLFTKCELIGGAHKSRNPERELSLVSTLLSRTHILFPELGYAAIYGEVYAFLSKTGTMIPQMDLLIGCHAKWAGLPVLTKDVEHFQRIPGLVVEIY